MTSANIVINQSGAPAGVAGQARSDLAIGTPVVLTNNDNAGVRTFRWSLKAPPGSSAVLTATIAPTTQFTPDIAGSYRIELEVNNGRGANRQVLIAAVLDSNGLRYPALREGSEFNEGGNVDGWGPALDQIMRFVAAGGGGGGGGFQTVYDLDFRDAHASLGTVNLNSPGASFTYDGITWRTPDSGVDGFAVNQAAMTSWELDSAGLTVDTGGANTSMFVNNIDCPLIYASLSDIASAAGFELDPYADWLIEARIPVQLFDGVTTARQGSFVMFYKSEEIDTAGGVVPRSQCWSFFGREFGPAFTQARGCYISDTSIVTRALQNFPNTDSPDAVPSAALLSGGAVGAQGAALWSGDWPTQRTYNSAHAHSNYDKIAPEVLYPHEAKICLGHIFEDSSGTYEGTIERFRILRR